MMLVVVMMMMVFIMMITRNDTLYGQHFVPLFAQVPLFTQDTKTTPTR